jgi:sugar lactone lactonase YvrE
MNTNNNFSKLNRRDFLAGAGVIASIGVTGLSAVDKKDGTLSAVSESGYNIQKLGTVDAKWLKYEEIRSFPLNEAPLRIEITQDEKIRIASEKKIIELNLEGKIENQYTLSETPKCFRTTADGKLYIGYKGYIDVHDKTGKNLNRWTSFPKTAWFTAIDEAGDYIFAADCGNRLVYKINKEGAIVSKFGESLSGKAKSIFIVPSPYFDLKCGKDGLLWIANPGKRMIEAYTTNGEFVKSWGKSSFGVDGFCGCCNPSYFTISSDGKFITSEKGLFRVKVYSPDGELEAVVGGMETFPEYYKNITPDIAPMDVAVDKNGKIYVADLIGKRVRVFKLKK